LAGSRYLGATLRPAVARLALGVLTAVDLAALPLLLLPNAAAICSAVNPEARANCTIWVSALSWLRDIRRCSSFSSLILAARTFSN